MRSFHGKPVDPREFKGKNLSNLENRVSEARENAKRFSDKAEIEVNECYVCGSAERKIVREMYGYQYARCENCTHVYLTKRLPRDAADEFFETSSEFASTYTDDDQIQYRLENVTKPKIDFVLDEIEATEGRWLDVGCGIGSSLYYLESQGWDAVGLELSDDCIEVGKERFGVEMRQEPIEEFVTEEPEWFDVVSFFGYFDLVPQPIEHLRIARELVHEDGDTVIGVTHADSVSSLVHEAIPNRAIRHSIPPVLIQQFTVESVATAFERTGFASETAWYFGLDFYELLKHLRLEIDGFGTSELYRYLMGNLNDFQLAIDEDEKSDYLMMIGAAQ